MLKNYIIILVFIISYLVVILVSVFNFRKRLIINDNEIVFIEFKKTVIPIKDIIDISGEIFKMFE